ncbi:thioredoxin-like protein [Dinghuibacter silviterrae]|uniref:Thioredoxin-like protein n=2 Tax=Dinghuibacter silviterrae TaxID=1539049 RepID=A0A4R8DU31_9BACT|nr:thioredoxin-like protein [Dinghuibacter silviterrae]
MRFWYLLILILCMQVQLSAASGMAKGDGSYFSFQVNSLSNDSLGERGVQFEQGLTWEQVKEKARAEHKYIFLDCFATWCGPCKAMDRDVYPDPEVGRILNRKFISVRVQMDKTNYDDEFIKQWYTDAETIQSDYTITAFPSFIFFSPEGIPLHKGVGYRNSEQFVELVNEVFAPDRQYYRVLANFGPGKIDTSELKGLARAFRLSDKFLAGEIAADYLTRIPSVELGLKDNIQLMMEFSYNQKVREIGLSYFSSLSSREICTEINLQLIEAFKSDTGMQKIILSYLKNLSIESVQKNILNLDLLVIFKNMPMVREVANKYVISLSEDRLYTIDNLKFIAEFTKTSQDKGFTLFFSHADKVDSIMHREGHVKNVAYVSNYATGITDNIIAKEEVGPYWEGAVKGERVNWRKISRVIRNKYNRKIADRVILNAKVSLYEFYAKKYNQQWSEYIKYNIRKIEVYGTDTTSGFFDSILLNNFSYYVFLHSQRKRQLNIVSEWMEGVVRRNPNDENDVDTYANILYKIGKKVAALEMEQKALIIAEGKKNEHGVKIFKDNILKMNGDKPTWIAK